MIYAARVGQVEIYLDDELEQRPTPEAAGEYARRAAAEALDLHRQLMADAHAWEAAHHPDATD